MTKRYNLHLIVAVLAIGGSSVACKRPEGLVGPTVLEGPTGTIVHNGLFPEVYHANKVELEARMIEPLASPPSGPPFTLDPHFGTLLKKPDGERLVDYAIDCAVEDDVPHAHPPYPPPPPIFIPGAVKKSTGSWTTTKLDLPDQRADLHTCIATRLNPTGAEVEIWLRGEQVTPSTKPNEYVVPEAFWTTDQDFKIHVWPSKAILNNCPDASGVAIPHRVCGFKPTNCKLQVETSTCTDDPDGHHCPLFSINKAVIETQMRCEDWCTFYPTCGLPEECRGPDKKIASCPCEGKTTFPCP